MWIAISNAIGSRQLVGGGPTPPSDTPILDDYPNAAAAYSVRLLSSSFSGSALRVRRTVAPFDEQDIGFDSNGDLDTAAISTFGGSDPLTVSVWYDQSGQSRHATQGTAGSQPSIYDGASVITENGKPIIKPNDNDDGFDAVGLDLSGQTCSLFSTSLISTNRGVLVYFGSIAELVHIGENASSLAIDGFDTSSATLHLNGVSETIGSYTRTDCINNFSNSQTLSSFVNFSGIAGTDMRITNYVNYYGMHALQEFIIYDSDQSSNRTGIESNTNTYYSIYPTSGLLADYPGAAAAYSVRQLSNTATLSMRVRRNAAPFDEQDIGFDSNGDLDTSAITTFGGSDPLTVSRWYDQTGNQNHAVQTGATAQPTIYDGVSVLTENGKPVIGFDGSKSLSTGVSISTSAATSFIVGGTQNGGNFVLGATGNTGVFYAVGENGSSSSSSSNFIVSSTHINGTSYSSPTRDQVFDNMASQGLLSTGFSLNSGTQVPELSYRHSSLFDDAQYQEYVLYLSDESSNRTGIETNINGYFNVYTEYNPDAPTSGFLFDYSGATAAYSIRQLNDNATYSMRVRRNVAPFDEQDIGFDGSGNLDTSAIATFGGSDEVVIARFYDQTGDQNHTASIPATAELLIYDGASVLTKNGKPIGQVHATSGSSGFSIGMQNSTGLSFTHSLYAVAQRPNAPSSLNMFGTTASGVAALYQERAGNLTYGPNWTAFGIYTYSTVTNTPRLYSYIRKNGTDGECFNDGVSQGTTTAMNASIQVDIKSVRADRNSSGVQADCGGVQEFIAYPDDRTAVGDNANILTNIKTYFTGIP